MLVTLGLTVFVDLITAVVVGLILAGFITAKWMEKEELKGLTSLAIPDDEKYFTDQERKALGKANGRIVVINLRGRFSYASARELIQHAHAVSVGYETIIFDMSEAAHVDTSAALAIDGFLSTVLSEGAQCYISGLSGPAKKTLGSLGVLKNIPASHVTASLLAAIKIANAARQPV